MPPTPLYVPRRPLPTAPRHVPPYAAPGGGWIARLAAADRACVARLGAAARGGAPLRLWRAVTHLGGTAATTAACAVPLLLGGRARDVGAYVTAVVLLSQALVHLTKRLVGRPRPARATGLAARAAEPDAFSFPSGHAAAAAAVAAGYAAASPAAAPALAAAAAVVAASRVVLGVHYVADVAAGALVAGAAAALVPPAAPAHWLAVHAPAWGAWWAAAWGGLVAGLARGPA